MKEFIEALCAHFEEFSPFVGWDTAHITQEVRWFSTNWRPATPTQGVDTSPAALRELANIWYHADSPEHQALAEVMRAVADEKEATEAQAVPNLRESILGAVARGWCARQRQLGANPANAGKVMDVDLANAICEEVMLLPEGPRT